MTLLRVNGDEWRNQPGKRRCQPPRDDYAASLERAQRELDAELKRPLIPPKERLREYR